MCMVDPELIDRRFQARISILYVRGHVECIGRLPFFRDFIWVIGRQLFEVCQKRVE